MSRPRLFPFARVCSLFGPFCKQTRAHFPAFVPILVDLGNKRREKETKAGKRNKSKEITLAQHQVRSAQHNKNGLKIISKPFCAISVINNRHQCRRASQRIATHRNASQRIATHRSRLLASVPTALSRHSKPCQPHKHSSERA